MDPARNRHSANAKKISWLRFSLRRFILGCLIVGTVIGLISVQQQRQRRFFQIVNFVECSFDTGAVVPAKIAERAAPQYSQINGKRWVSSVSHSPNNGPAFISSEHELIYRPSGSGNKLADITIVTKWHVLEIHPTIEIKSGGGEFDEIPLEWLKQSLLENFGVAPIVNGNAG